MAYPTASGMPNYSGSGTNRFIPEIWSTKLIKKFYDATVLTAISNTEYEGEIKTHGDKVIMRTSPNITIKDYVIGQKLDYDRPESPAIELLIDKGKYFGFTVDDVHAYQADIRLLDNWSTDASEQLKIALETGILSTLYADAASTNKGNTAGRKTGSLALGATSAPLVLTKTNILDVIVDAGTALDENNIPESGRYLLLPPHIIGLIKKSDFKDTNISGGSGEVIRNGRVGMIDRFTVYSSNLLPSTTDTGLCYYMYFGVPYALTFASQITKTETLRAESTFGDLVRGLQVYGYKVIKPEALGVIYGYKG